MKLQIELVPRTSWGQNLRKQLGPSRWKIVGEKAYADYDYKCGICGAPGRLECHELWEYDDTKHIQFLKGFIALCSLCHKIKHFGNTSTLAAQGELDLEAVIRHALNVNGCTRDEFEGHRSQAFTIWRERSKHPWTIDLGVYKSLLDPKRMAALPHTDA